MNEDRPDPDMLDPATQSRPELATRGQEARKARRAMVKQRVTIRLDADVIEGFKSLVEGERGYQSLINQALCEWLVARGVLQLVEAQVERLCDDARAEITRCINEAAQAHP